MIALRQAAVGVVPLLMVWALVRASDTPPASTSNASPWAFKDGSAEGYSVDALKITPAPGTYLPSGKMTEIKVDLKYTLTAAPHGTLALVLENEKSQPLKPAGDQVSQSVDSPGGTLTLSDFVVIPAGVAELRVYIPLTPAGAQTGVRGTIGVRYPIAHAGSLAAHLARSFPLVADYYPVLARRRGEAGAIQMLACMDESGKLTQDVVVLQSSGFADLDRGAYALATAGSGHYVPLRQDGHSVAGCLPFMIQFRPP